MIDDIDWVPNCIGAKELKEILFVFVQQGWHEYAPGFPVLIDDFKMLHPKKKGGMSPIIAAEPDTFCLKHLFPVYKKGKPPTEALSIEIAFALKTAQYEKFVLWDAGGRPTDEDGLYVQPSTDLMHSHDNTIIRRKKGVMVSYGLWHSYFNADYRTQNSNVASSVLPDTVATSAIDAMPMEYKRGPSLKGKGKGKMVSTVNGHSTDMALTLCVWFSRLIR